MTALPDVNGNTVLTALLPITTLTTSGNGPAIDVRQLSGVGAVVLDVSAGTGTAPTLTGNVQDSPDGTTGWATIPGSFLGSFTTVAGQTKLGVNWNSCRGWVRLNYTIGGTTPSYTVSAMAVSRPEL
jgi:hypothetical protein